MTAAAVILFIERRRLRRNLPIAVPAIAAAGVSLLLVVALTPLKSRFLSIAEIGRGTARGRLLQWGLTVDMVRDRPILGWGPETYAFVFPRYINARFERTVRREVIPDRAHNVLLEVAASSGLLGLAAFTAVVVLVIAVAARARERSPASVGLLGGLLGYLVQLQFSFPLADLDVLFWLFAGLLSGATARDRGFLKIDRRWAVAPAAAGLLLGVWAGRDVVADRQLRAALEAGGRGDFTRARLGLEEAVTAAGERLQYLQAAARFYRRAGEATGGDAAFAEGLEKIERALRIAPLDLEFAMDRADLLLGWGEASTSRERLPAAIRAYERILAEDRYSSRVFLKLGVARADLGDLRAAEWAWLRAAYLAPRFPGPLLNLGLLYEKEGRKVEAREVLERALRLDPDNSAVSAALARLGP